MGRIDPADAMTWDDVFVDPVMSQRFVEAVQMSMRVGPTPWNRYVSRAELERRLVPVPGEPNAVEGVWSMVRISREPYRTLPFADAAGTPFRYARGAHHDLAMELEFARVHQGLSIERWLREPVGTDYLAERMRRAEAWATSALDGFDLPAAHVREMFEQGRFPATAGELAVRKAYSELHRMQSLDLRAVPSLEWLLGLHERVTAGTTARADAPGRLRRPGEQPAHAGVAPAGIPLPPAEALPEQLAAVLAMFDRKPLDWMTVEKALLALFAISVLRPFAEGNGRMARLLYYGFLAMRQPATPVQLVAVSPILHRLHDPFGAWTRAAVEDGNDVGYFVHPAMYLVRGAMRRVQRTLYLLDDVDHAVRARFPRAELNARQLQVLAGFIRRPQRAVTVEAHRRNHATVYETARTDLAVLADLGLARQEKQGRAFIYHPPDALADRIGLVPDAGAAD